MKPLEGLVVVAVEQAVAAPLCSLRLAQAGARVIKVERAEGDLARGYDDAAGGDSSYFAWLNQGKESVVLDFKTPEGAALLRAMLARADVFIQNFAPGALDRAGFSHEELAALNPRLVRCDISGYGSGPETAQKRGYDLLVQAESGLIAVSGSPGAPGRIGVSVCDIGAGMTAHAAVLEALLSRGITGRGAHLEVSLFGVSAEWMTVPFVHAEYGKGAPRPAGLKHPSIAPYGAFPTADGREILIAVQNEREWQRLCRDVLGDAGLAGREAYASNIARVENREALDQEIAAITSRMESDRFCGLLDAARIAYGRLNGAADLSGHAAFRTVRVRNSGGSEISLPAPPAVDLADIPRTGGPVPKVGQQTEAIRREFGA